MRILIFLFFLIALSNAQAASLRVNEIFVRLQGVIEEKTPFEDLVTELGKLENPELAEVLKEFDLTWKPLRSAYFTDYEKFVTGSMTGEKRQETRAAIKEYREQFMQVYRKPEGPMKPLLKTKSMPALQALEKLIAPTPEEILATALPALETRRRIILILGKFRDAIVDIAVLPDQEKAEAGVWAEEAGLIASLSGLPRDGLRVMKGNDEIAAKSNLPSDEREGIRQLNEWRLLLGLNALVIDPRLCEAGRGHSEDMHTHQFFAHESPLPGKKTPWDRAANAGTKARGENIYMGSPSPGSANKGWFFSPGHHKNMFKTSHLKIGLGRYQKHWTQLFG